MMLRILHFLMVIFHIRVMNIPSYTDFTLSILFRTLLTTTSFKTSPSTGACYDFVYPSTDNWFLFYFIFTRIYIVRRIWNSYFLTLSHVARCYATRIDIHVIEFCILYSSCHRHWIVSLVIIGILYAHVQFTLGNFNTLVLLIGGHWYIE